MKPHDIQLVALLDGQQKTVRLYPVFYYNNTNCELRQLLIFSDRTIVCDSRAYDLSGLRNLMRQGIVRTTLPDNEGLYVPELIYLRATNILPIVEEEECLKEIEDVFREMNGQPTTSDLCRASYQQYLQNPNEDSRNNLRQAYEKVPRHLDCWLLGFPEKDAPIRQIIYGNEG